MGDEEGDDNIEEEEAVDYQNDGHHAFLGGYLTEC